MVDAVTSSSCPARLSVCSLLRVSCSARDETAATADAELEEVCVELDSHSASRRTCSHIELSCGGNIMITTS